MVSYDGCLSPILLYPGIYFSCMGPSTGSNGVFHLSQCGISIPQKIWIKIYEIIWSFGRELKTFWIAFLILNTLSDYIPAKLSGFTFLHSLFIIGIANLAIAYLRMGLCLRLKAINVVAVTWVCQGWVLYSVTGITKCSCVCACLSLLEPDLFVYFVFLCIAFSGDLVCLFE